MFLIFNLNPNHLLFWMDIEQNCANILVIGDNILQRVMLVYSVVQDLKINRKQL
jgi:hypothetical protein